MMEKANGWRRLPSGNDGLFEDGVLVGVQYPEAELAQQLAELEAERRNERFWENRADYSGLPDWAV